MLLLAARSMKVVKLLHNPKAGDQQHSKKKLVELIESKGYKCLYASLKKSGWGKIESSVDIVAIAGGDGTVIKVVNKFLRRSLIDRKFPLALLPMGTANNIATALGITQPTREVIESWKHAMIRKYDIGSVHGIGEPAFVESMGFGAFTATIRKMQSIEKQLESDPEHRLSTATSVFRDIVHSYRGRKCKVIADGVSYPGKFLMIEIMNTPFIGPNLDINPTAELGDGIFEVILVSEGQREQLYRYLEDKFLGGQTSFSFQPIKARKVQLEWEGMNMHIDGEIVKAGRPIRVHIEARPGLFDFLVPGEPAI